MANTQRSRVSPQVLQADIEAFMALTAIPGYAPANPDFAFSSIAKLHENLQALLATEFHAQNTLAAARDAAQAAQWQFHDAILGVKNQVKAQYGENSDQLAALGLKKKSDRKAPTKSGKAAATED
ncbi:hypothetical protein ETQ85_04020 [Zoogloea oleivorans]|uniref:Uncharacterized protein n=2 Tax=Zoogloea oleivorans TaxID=1552750 RepID=A0A6C2D5U0_9RHOO|nr:hypothetical protein [Zoogloea oleivorans]TYC61234.1 hypothetical protein ETQ85_04020 [Zoogloea oleivorans]